MGGDVGLAQGLATALALLAVVAGLERWGGLEARPRALRYGVMTAALFATAVVLNLVWPAGL